MGKEDRIRNEAFQWLRAKVFNSSKTSIGRTIAFGCAIRCHLSVHSLTHPRLGSGDDSCLGGAGMGAPGDGPRSRRCGSSEVNHSEGG